MPAAAPPAPRGPAPTRATQTSRCQMHSSVSRSLRILISGSVSSVVAKLNRKQRRSVDLQRENIRPRIVTGHVEGTARARRRRRLDLAIEHGPVSIVRPGLDLPERPDNQRPSVTDPFIAVRK